MPRALTSLALAATAMALAAEAAGADSFRYDGLGRLIYASLDGASATTYTYDAAGNRLTRTATAAAALSAPTSASLAAAELSPLGRFEPAPVRLADASAPSQDRLTLGRVAPPGSWKSVR